MRLNFLTAMAAGAGALALGMAMATPAGAAAGDFLGGCQLSDLTTPNADACNGFFEGNLLNDSPTDLAIQTTALAALGLTWDGTLEEAQLDLNDPNIDFTTLLSGVTYIGVHWGKGQGPVDVQGGVTGFYRLDLAPDAELDVILSAFGSQSGARLYLTSPCVGADCGGGGGNEVPEPATWAMMILGFGGVGAVMRRRRFELAAA
jgi:hypothetical protein